jgi:hypothetical protein
MYGSDTRLLQQPFIGFVHAMHARGHGGVRAYLEACEAAPVPRCSSMFCCSRLASLSADAAMFLGHERCGANDAGAGSRAAALRGDGPRELARVMEGGRSKASGGRRDGGLADCVSRTPSRRLEANLHAINRV